MNIRYKYHGYLQEETVKLDEWPVKALMVPMKLFESPKYENLYMPLGVPLSIALYMTEPICQSCREKELTMRY